MPATPPKQHQFKPGQSGNPTGGLKLPEHLAKVRTFTRTEINATFSQFLRMTKDELQEVFNDSSTSALDLWIVSSIIGGIKKSEIGNLMMMLERMFGRGQFVKDLPERPDGTPPPQIILTLPSNGREVTINTTAKPDEPNHG